MFVGHYMNINHNLYMLGEKAEHTKFHPVLGKPWKLKRRNEFKQQ